MGPRFWRALILAPILGVGFVWQGFVNMSNGNTGFGLFGIMLGLLALGAFVFGLRRMLRH